MDRLIIFDDQDPFFSLMNRVDPIGSRLTFEVKK